MKGIISILLTITALTALYCSNRAGKDSLNSITESAKNSNVEILFREYEHDFGKVSEGEKVACVFTFENRGSADLVIKSAITTCGCTVPKFDNKPVAPGEKGNIEVQFDTSGRNGMQAKTITVKSNASVPAVILKITAEVVTNIN